MVEKYWAEPFATVDDRFESKHPVMVMHSDYAALEARCRDAAKLISDVVETPDQFETEWNKAAREWLASTSETGDKHD